MTDNPLKGIRFRVRYAETDQMGIVHHSVYPVWFECGRSDFIRSAGMSYSELEENGLLLPLLKLSCEYKAPARYDELVTVRTGVKVSSRTRITFFYEVYNEHNNLLCYGETEHAWVDRNMRPVNFQKSFPKLYEKLKELFDQR